MIHIIGIAHERSQFLSDAIRSGESLDTDLATVEQFERYLHDTAVSLRAKAIGEELSKQVVKSKKGGISIAKKVAEELGLFHVFCDPDQHERCKLGIKTADDREIVWLSRLNPLSPNETSIVFVCGATHCDTFKAKLDQNGLHARVHCDDWTLRMS